MINFPKQGDYLKIGLNITFGRYGWKPWIRFVWCWYSIKSRMLSYRSLRVRMHMRPMIVSQSSESDTISNYLMLHDLIACPRELLEDHAPKLIPLAAYFNQQFKTGVIGRYNG